MTSSNETIFRVTGHLCGKFTGHRWIPRTKASDAELWCFLWSAPWINAWVNNRETGDLRRHRAHYDVIVMDHFRRFALLALGQSYDCHMHCASPAIVWLPKSQWINPGGFCEIPTIQNQIKTRQSVNGMLISTGIIMLILSHYTFSNFVSLSTFYPKGPFFISL